MHATRESVEVSLVLYPHAQASAVHGLTDLFLIANEQFARRQPSAVRRIRVSHWAKSSATTEGLQRVFDSAPGGSVAHPDFLIVPPSLAAPIKKVDAAETAIWLAEMHELGSVLCSVCAGIFLLAETGLLNERAATTHWSYQAELTRQFPRVKVEIEKLLIDDVDLITAGGLMAWLDLGLTIVEKVFGEATMYDTARFMVVDPPSREQRAYVTFIPKLNHGDLEILSSQHRMQKNCADDMSLADLAHQAGLGERTFIRRFSKATGLKPTAYRRQLRITKARDLLDLTNKSIEEISWEVGYEDVGAFRKVFTKQIGLSPYRYRSRTKTLLKPRD